MRSGRRLALLVRLWVGLVAALFVAAVLFMLQRGPFRIAMLDPVGWSYLLLGALIVLRRPGNPIGLLLMATGSVSALPIFALQQFAPSDPDAVGPLWVWLDLFADLAFVPLVFPILFVLLLFPSGRLPGPRWRPVVAYGLLLALGIWLLSGLAPELQIGETSVRNPVSPLVGAAAELHQTIVDSGDTPFQVAILLFVLASAAAPFVRYRRAGAVERTQIRWLLYAATLYAAGFAFVLVSGFERRLLLPEALWGLGILAVPIAIAIAILRHHLFDIDVIIRRTLQYSVLTATLVGLYFGSVLLLQTLLGGVIGGTDSPPVVIVTTLALAALFNPLRVRVQRFIDRRFYRSKVDAERALARFAALARDEVDLTEIRRALFDMVEETMQPERVGLWLKPASRERRSGGVR